MNVCLIALGSNIGASEELFHEAMRRLTRPGIERIQLSSVMTTRPVGELAGEAFLNAAATLHCGLLPLELLQALHEVEHELGRHRTIHWGPRTLDLDLCLYEGQVVSQSRIVVPHPAMWYRRFVLDPAVEIASEMVHPILGQSVGELHQQLHRRPVSILVSEADATDECSMSRKIVEALDGADTDVEWHCGLRTSTSTQQFFAELLIEISAKNPDLRCQPPNESRRSIRIRAQSETDAVRQIRALKLAITG